MENKPILIDFDITNRCNSECIYCSSKSTYEENTDELSLSDIHNLFEEFEVLNVLKVSIGGGEPFCRKDIWEILEDFQKYSFLKILNTNGILINEDVAKKLRTLSIDRVCVTLDGSTSNVHDYGRGDGTFIKTINGLKNLIKYNIPVTILFTLGNHNTCDLINTIKLAEIIGVKSFTAMVICSTGRASSGEFCLKKETWYPEFFKLSQMIYDNEFKINIRIIPPNESDVMWTHYYPLEYYNRLDLLDVWHSNFNIIDKNKTREISCQAAKSSCSISSNGDVFGCNLMSSIPEMCAGNIKEYKLSHIWKHSKIFQEIRNMKFKDIRGKCSECDNFWCGGGCRSNAMNLTGTILGSDLNCFKE
jgi:radical SAM domain protein